MSHLHKIDEHEVATIPRCATAVHEAGHWSGLHTEASPPSAVQTPVEHRSQTRIDGEGELYRQQHFRTGGRAHRRASLQEAFADEAEQRDAAEVDSGASEPCGQRALVHRGIGGDPTTQSQSRRWLRVTTTSRRRTERRACRSAGHRALLIEDIDLFARVTRTAGCVTGSRRCRTSRPSRTLSNSWAATIRGNRHN